MYYYTSLLFTVFKQKRSIMTVALLSSLFILVNSQSTGVYVKDGDVLTISLLNYSVITSPGKIVEEYVDIAPSSRIAVNVTDIPLDGSFVLLQAHSYRYDIILSYNRTLLPHSYVNGSNVGLVQNVIRKKHSPFFIHNISPVDNVSALIVAQLYGADAPVPGGCNMEFSVEIAPYLKLTETDSVVVVESQPPALSTNTQDCESSPPSEVFMYHMYLPEMDFSSQTYFRALRAMMTVQEIKEHGILSDHTMIGSSLRRTYNAYRGTGAVYGAIATSGFSGSAYVPSVTYSCNGQVTADSCEVLTTVLSKVLCATAFFLGVFTCFLGHNFFKTEMFLAGFLAGGVVVYILLALQNTFATTETVSVMAGLMFGVVWLLLWYFCGIPVISILLPSLTFGFLIASVSMYAKLADVPELENDANFWAAFVCIMLAVQLLCPPVTSKTNMVSCAVLGGYATIIPVDYYIGSNLKYVVVNTIRRATVTGYNVAIIDPPFQLRDILLVAAWLSLSVLGFAVQTWQQKGKPPFPPPPYRSRNRRLIARSLSSQTPLLIDAHIPYGTASEEPITTEQRFTFLPKLPRISLPVQE